MTTTDDWTPFAEAHRAAPAARPGAEPDDDLAATFARCFATPDGQRVLAHLRHRTISRICGPEASEALLRHAEGQRQLVASIIALTQRGGGVTP